MSDMGMDGNVIRHIERENLDDDARILIEVGLEDTGATPTNKGLSTLFALLYKANRRELADKCRAMRAYKAAKEAAKVGTAPEQDETEKAAANKARSTAAKNGKATASQD